MMTHKIMTEIANDVRDIMIQEKVEFFLDPQDLAVAVLIPVKEMLDFVFQEDASKALASIIKTIESLEPQLTH